MAEPTLAQATLDLEAALRRFHTALTHAQGGPPEPLETPTGPLFQALRQWRAEQARTKRMPPYIIATDAVLRAIETHRPETLERLAAIRGFGAAKATQYGPDILQIVASAHVATAA